MRLPCVNRFFLLLEVLEERDLLPAMGKMREQLMSRNVASEVANDITASVQATLTNQKLKSFTRCEAVPFVSCLSSTHVFFLRCSSKTNTSKYDRTRQFRPGPSRPNILLIIIVMCGSV